MTINSIFIGIIVILFAYSCFSNRFSVEKISSTMISIGILGTFTGIFIGLRSFDSSDISGSIPPLLDGLKTAFSTSIAGMSASLVLKVVKEFVNYFKNKNAIDIQGESEVEKMINTLDKISNAMIKSSIITTKSIQKIEKCIVGDGDSTLITQLQKLRSSNQDKFDKLTNSINDFAEKVVADSTQSLIDALKEVIKDFNSKINEQFGENFKHLNESVGKMIIWQDKYSDHVEKMTEQLNNSFQVIDQTKDILSDITEKSSVYKENSETLNRVLDYLNKNLLSFADLADKAKETFPIIDAKLKELTVDLTDSVSEIINSTEKTVKVQEDAISTQISTFSDAYQNLGDQHMKLLKDLDTQINKLVENNSKRITEQLKNIDDQLADELNKALSTLGSQLASLSSKFVSDYTPLTDNLKKLISSLSIESV